MILFNFKNSTDIISNQNEFSSNLAQGSLKN